MVQQLRLFRYAIYTSSAIVHVDIDIARSVANPLF